MKKILMICLWSDGNITIMAYKLVSSAISVPLKIVTRVKHVEVQSAYHLFVEIRNQEFVSLIVYNESKSSFSGGHVWAYDCVCMRMRVRSHMCVCACMCVYVRLLPLRASFYVIMGVHVCILARAVMCVLKHMCVWVRAFSHVRALARGRLCAHVCSCVRACASLRPYTCALMYMPACMCACICACVCICARVCICASVSMYAHVRFRVSDEINKYTPSLHFYPNLMILPQSIRPGIEQEKWCYLGIERYRRTTQVLQRENNILQQVDLTCTHRYAEREHRFRLLFCRWVSRQNTLHVRVSRMQSSFDSYYFGVLLVLNTSQSQHVQFLSRLQILNPQTY